MNRNIVVVPASTTANTTLLLPVLRAKNGLTGFVGRSWVRVLFHTLRNCDHILAIWLVVEGTVANNLSSSSKVGSGVVRALREVMRYFAANIGERT